MLRPIIMIGCGGSGQKTVQYVRDAVSRRLKHAGWNQDFPRFLQFLSLDITNTQANVGIPCLPDSDYLNVSFGFDSFRQLDNALLAKFGPDINPDAFRELQGWRPNPSQVDTPIPGPSPFHWRAVSRMAGFLSCQDVVRQRIQNAFSQCAAGGPELIEISKHLGENFPPGTPTPDPIVLVIGSMAGGTGAGIMLDVIDLVRSCHTGGTYPILVAFTPDIFGSVHTDAMTANSAANSAAFMSELLSAYWDTDRAESSLIPTEVQVDNRGPHSTFLISRTNVDGLDLQASNNVYRAVGEALAAIATSPSVQSMFQNFLITDWSHRAASNAGGYGFAAVELPGVVSSFGSATVSIGRNRFRDYLQKLLHRSIVERLSDGFESVAVSVLGLSVAESMAGAAKIAELACRNVDQFLLECGLQEGSGSSQQVTQRFVSNEILKTKVDETALKIRQPFSPGQQMNGATWQQMIFVKSQEVRVQTLQSIESELTREIRAWGSEVLRNVLKTTTEHSATLSMPVVLKMLEMSRSTVLEAAQQVREEAKQNRELAVQHEARARGHLGQKPRGNLALTATPVGETISDMARVVVLEWSAQVREKIAVSLEAVVHAMLSSVEAGLQQSLSRINTLVTSPVSAGWPKNNGVVPTSFAPSPVEFYLEPYETWSAQAGELLSKSLGDSREGLPLDPVEAACTLIIRGGFSSGGSQSTAPPLVWADGYSIEPEWEAGHPVSIKVFDELEVLGERINQWLNRPATDLNHILSEGLGDYLEIIHPKTKAPIPNHQERLSRFRQMLQLALMRSRPLIEIDAGMNATVHPQPLNYDLNIQGFPFGVGHPARKETEEIIQGFLSTAESVGWAFTSSETESVLLTSFLKHPVNPSVVRSVTQPLHSALQIYGPQPALLRSFFWQWRRARVLEDFIPLPDRLRIAAIRGFAVARATGLITAHTNEQNKISTESGVFLFPRNLLTEYNKDNTLAVLLEAMILAFGEAPTKGKAAFDAYGALIELGTSGGSVRGFAVDGLFRKILVDGDYGSAEIVDLHRANAIADVSLNERIKKVMTYLTANIQRFDSLEAEGFNPRSWRSAHGSIEPADTLTKEILNDARHAYSEVLDAVRKLQFRILVT